MLRHPLKRYHVKREGLDLSKVGLWVLWLNQTMNKICNSCDSNMTDQFQIRSLYLELTCCIKQDWKLFSPRCRTKLIYLQYSLYLYMLCTCSEHSTVADWVLIIGLKKPLFLPQLWFWRLVSSWKPNLAVTKRMQWLYNTHRMMYQGHKGRGYPISVALTTFLFGGNFFF